MWEDVTMGGVRKKAERRMESRPQGVGPSPTTEKELGARCVCGLGLASELLSPSVSFSS